MANNREILFRGFYPCEDGETTIYVEGKAVKGRWVKGIPINKKRQMIINCLEIVELKGEDCMSLKGIIRKVHPSTVCEYTSLTDKNGRKVFIGDIVNCSCGCPHEVVFLNGYAGTYGGGMPAIYLSNLREGYAWTGAEEVIGTIWDKERQDERD